jgi:transcriptional regulator with XRE-family HTH domain
MGGELAGILLKLRKEAQLTQEEVASATGLSIHNVRNYERGSRTPNLAAALRLAKLFKVSLESLAEKVAPEDVERPKKASPKKPAAAPPAKPAVRPKKPAADAAKKARKKGDAS